MGRSSKKPAQKATTKQTAEHKRLLEYRRKVKDWKRWGPYLAERAWGTVREDYSADGSAWSYLTHEHSRSKAYRWGDDGIAGICDNQQILCFSLAMWNTHDPILKERLFGLTGPEGNHGEDVKEVYYYLDATPTSSYLKYLYKYPQRPFPYDKLIEVNQHRSQQESEYELTDTGIFDDSRYFDVFIEYAKAAPEQIHIRITAHNRGPDRAALHLIPQMWFRNEWAWNEKRRAEPMLRLLNTGDDRTGISAHHSRLGERFLYAQGSPTVLFTDNETNTHRLYGTPSPSGRPYAKDAFHDYIIHAKQDAVRNDRCGTKVGLQYVLDIDAGESASITLVLTDQASRPADSKKVFAKAIAEADAFYTTVAQENFNEEERRVQRQALAGMLWSQQFYKLDMRTWLNGDNPNIPLPRTREQARNRDWEHISIGDIISMPDKWEYPWFAAWDWAFHAIPLAMVDIDLAKQQLELLLSEKLQHPNGQIPAYEWSFSDVNPPVYAWAVWRVYNMEKHELGEAGDIDFLERCYHKLLLNFTWWVNRKDSHGRNIFNGGFLGLDNISVFDRSQPLPQGGMIEQADATGWMGLFSLNMMSIGLELAQSRQVYEHLGVKFFEHFMDISHAINNEIAPGVSLWNEQDGWYYDVIHSEHDGSGSQLKVRSQVGLIPMFAAMVLEHSWFDHLPNFKARYEWVLTNRPELAAGIACIWTPDGARCLLSIVNFDRLKRILACMLSESEFLSPHGIRALSRCHLNNPYTLAFGDREWTVKYEPAESTTRLFGGNSNWRGPVWFPTNFMIITALRVLDRFFGDDFKVECPTGSGNMMTLNEVAMEISRRLCSIFLPNEQGNRDVFGGSKLYNQDPHFRNYLLFYEYFHGDNGAGLGANHQTGWTGLVAKLLDQRAKTRTEKK